MSEAEEHARLCADMMSGVGAMPGMMGGMPGMMGGMGSMVGMALWLLVSVATVVLVVVAIALVLRGARRLDTAPSDARSVADLRYARGELTRDEYVAIRHELEARS